MPRRVEPSDHYIGPIIRTQGDIKRLQMAERQYEDARILLRDSIDAFRHGDLTEAYSKAEEAEKMMYGYRNTLNAIEGLHASEVRSDA